MATPFIAVAMSFMASPSREAASAVSWSITTPSRAAWSTSARIPPAPCASMGISDTPALPKICVAKAARVAASGTAARASAIA